MGAAARGVIGDDRNPRRSVPTSNCVAIDARTRLDLDAVPPGRKDLSGSADAVGKKRLVDQIIGPISGRIDGAWHFDGKADAAGLDRRVDVGRLPESASDDSVPTIALRARGVVGRGVRNVGAPASQVTARPFHA